ncbi:beta-galactosidase small subunit [Enterococcus hirae]|nr:beta-galactosidase small subunit [Enterococcus hirae]
MENTAIKMKIIYGDCTFALKGEGFHYIFSYTRGGLESLNKNGKEWLYRETLPTFWRALTDNDRGNGFGYRSSMWLGAGMYPKVKNVQVSIDQKPIEQPIAPINNRYSNHEYAQSAAIKFTLEINTVPKTEVVVNYEVQSDGEMKISVFYHGQQGLPELPLLGFRFIMPTKAKYFEYEGLYYQEKRIQIEWQEESRVLIK